MDGGIVGFRVDITELKSALMRIQSEEELAEQLFAGAVMGPNVRVPSLRMIVPRVSGRLAGVAAAGFALFLAIASFTILHSNLVLQGVTP